MNLTCLPSGKESIGHNFVEITAGKRGCSSGPGMSARDLAGKLLILLHDRNRHRGCMAALTDADPVFDTVAAMRHYMVNHWGTMPADVDVLLAGGLMHSSEFTHHLGAHLKRMQLDTKVLDARRLTSRALGPAPLDASPCHIYYDPAGARVEMVLDDEEPGGRAYGHDNGVVVLGKTENKNQLQESEQGASHG